MNNPNYPINRLLHLVTKGQPKGEAKAFINLALSPACQKIVKQKYIGVIKSYARHKGDDCESLNLLFPEAKI